MEYTTLGETGMTVSRLCLGCMSFATDGNDWADWVLEEDESRRIIDRAIDLGINFFDTANMYSRGGSEIVLGRALAEYDADWPVVATKVYHEMDPENPNASGLSRKAIEQELTNSLDRLGMDTIDLYQIHRWDDETPIAETMAALDDAVRRNQVRYLGASSMRTYQFAEAIHTSESLGLERFVSMQNHYNLAYREEEREMLPFCQERGIGVIPWSPLGRGYLTRPHREMDATDRAAEDGKMFRLPYREGGGRDINERVEELADQHDVTMAQLALAWILHQEWVDAPIIGTTSIDHLEQAVAALDISLSDSDLEYLEAPYEPVRVAD